MPNAGGLGECLCFTWNITNVPGDCAVGGIGTPIDMFHVKHGEPRQLHSGLRSEPRDAHTPNCSTWNTGESIRKVRGITPMGQTDVSRETFSGISEWHIGAGCSTWNIYCQRSFFVGMPLARG